MNIGPAELIIILAVLIPCAIGTGKIAEKKGYSYSLFALIGLVTGLIGVFIAAFIPDKNHKETSQADTLLTYKELLDKGAITQEEYDQKKQSLMGK